MHDLGPLFLPLFLAHGLLHTSIRNSFMGHTNAYISIYHVLLVHAFLLQQVLSSVIDMIGCQIVHG